MSDTADLRPGSELELCERDLDALLELSDALVDTADIDGSLRRITERLSGALASDRCSVVLLDAEARSGFVVIASDDPSIANLPVDLSAYPEIREVVRTRAPLVIHDVHRAPLFDEVRELIRDKPLGSTILFPVELDHRVQGVLLLRTRRPRTRELTRAEVRFGRIVANTTAIALRNARVYEVVRGQSERRHRARLRAERRLRQIEKYQRFFDTAGDGLMIVDGDGRILFANRASREVLGFDEAVITRIGLRDVVAREGDRALAGILSAIRAGDFVRDVDLGVLRADGAECVLSLTTAPLEEPAREGELPMVMEASRRLRAAEPAGGARTAIVSFRDVTETRRIERELLRTKDFLAKVIASSADAIVVTDVEGRLLLFNQAAERITGLAAAEAIGARLELVVPPGTTAALLAELRAEGAEGRAGQRRHDVLARDGERVPVQLAASLVRDEGGRELAVVVLFSDLRERLRLEGELSRAQARLELSARQAAVVQLAGAAAHELNQPLTSIVGCTELLQRRLPPGGPGEALLGTLLAEAERMAGIVRKLGQVTRYETKRYVGGTDIVDLDAGSEDGPSR